MATLAQTVSINLSEGRVGLSYAYADRAGQGLTWQFPVAARARLGHITNATDLISSKLPALHFYQLGLPAPKPPGGSFDPLVAERGDRLFSGKAQCARCHVEPTGSEPGWNLHTPAEIGIDDFQANRSPDRRYRTSALRGLFAHSKGGFYHDGRFASRQKHPKLASASAMVSGGA